MNSTTPPLLQVRSLSVTPAGAHSGVRAVDAVSLQVQRGSILGIAGESGCGKTQLLLALLGLSPVRWCKVRCYGKGRPCPLRAHRVCVVIASPWCSRTR